VLDLILSFVAGSIIGSFCNVVIYRLPRRESIIIPGSQCRSCGNAIQPWDNIPLLSYLILKGRCRACREYISLRYPIIELITGLLFVALYSKFKFSVDFIIYTILSTILLVISMIDYDFKIIPDIITIPVMMLGLLLSFLALPITFFNSFFGLLIGGAIFYSIAIITKGGMGGGDIKLISMIGTYVGWQGVLFTIFSGAMIGSVIGLILVLAKKKNRHDKIPFGPFLAGGAVLFILLGNNLIHWYLNLFS